MENTCEWGYLEDDDAQETSCNEMHYLNSGDPETNRYKFFPYCGQRLTMRAPDASPQEARRSEVIRLASVKTTVRRTLNRKKRDV